MCDKQISVQHCRCSSQPGTAKTRKIALAAWWRTSFDLVLVQELGAGFNYQLSLAAAGNGRSRRGTGHM